MWRRWTFTVVSQIVSSCAMSLFGLPLARLRRTSISLGVNSPAEISRRWRPGTLPDHRGAPAATAATGIAVRSRPAQPDALDQDAWSTEVE